MIKAKQREAKHSFAAEVFNCDQVSIFVNSQEPGTAARRRLHSPSSVILPAKKHMLPINYIYCSLHNIIVPLHMFHSLFYIKITVSVIKSIHQDCGSWYLHLPCLFLYTNSPLLLENNKLLWLLFSSSNKTTDHCSMIYITRLF